MMGACIQTGFRRWFPYALFFFIAPAFSVSAPSAPDIEIRSVGFKPDDLDKMVLKYWVDSNILVGTLTLLYSDDLNQQFEPIPYETDPVDDAILFFNNPGTNTDNAGQMSFQLRTQAMGEAISSKIHSVIFLEEPLVLVADCLPAIHFSWWNYAVFDRSLDPSLPQLPPHFDSVKVFFWEKDVEETCGKFLAQEPDTTLEPQPIGQSSLVLPVAADPGVYCLRIISESSEENLVSHSNTRELIIEGPEQPAPVSLTLVTVLPDNLEVKVVAYSGHEMDDSYHYGLFRSRDRNNPEYKLIGAYPGSDLAPDGRMVFRDDDTNRPWTEGSVYYYITTSLAGCPTNEQAVSDTVSSLFLQVVPITPSENRNVFSVAWQHDPAESNNLYDLEVLSSNRPEFEPISLSITDQYLATVELPETDLRGSIFFRMQVETDQTEITYSNTVILRTEPTVDFVNAFRPDSQFEKNQVFAPKFEFIVPEDQGYLFRVFNRWHQLVYSSRIPPKPDEFPNRESKWDGNVDGQPAPPGVYVYVLEYVYGGEVFREQGTVMLVR